MKKRHTLEHVETWRQEGAVVVPKFFKRNEITAVIADFGIIFPGRKAEMDAMNKKNKRRSRQ